MVLVLESNLLGTSLPPPALDVRPSAETTSQARRPNRFVRLSRITMIISIPASAPLWTSSLFKITDGTHAMKKEKKIYTSFPLAAKWLKHVTDPRQTIFSSSPDDFLSFVLWWAKVIARPEGNKGGCVWVGGWRNLRKNHIQRLPTKIYFVKN